MPGERDLATLLGSMRPRLDDATYVFVTTREPIEGMEPRLMFVEAEGTTLVLEKSQAQAAGLDYAFPCRLMTLTAASALDAVGFLAAVTARLAEESISVNVVSAVHHDHLFVPVARADDAMAALTALAADFSAARPGLSP